MERSEHRSAPETKRLRVRSELESARGEQEEIAITLGPDGMPRAVAFIDIDGTLADLKFVHGEAIAKLFPDEEPEELAQTFFKGFKLGSSVFEYDRMFGIYKNGQIAWKDPEVYRRERLEPHREEIENTESDAHAVATDYGTRYSEVAAGMVDELYRREPALFEDAKIKPIFHLVDLYKRLGIPMVGITANGKAFTKAITKCWGLGSSFIDFATGETMEGGGKEIAIEYLMRELQEKGIPVPKDRLVIVGDSLRGDIGSGARLSARDESVKSKGVLVLEDQRALADIQKQIAEDPTLQQIVETVDTSGLVIDDVPVGPGGRPVLGSRRREQFFTKL